MQHFWIFLPLLYRGGGGMNSNDKKKIRQDYIPVITRKETTRVYLKDILYIETQLRVIIIYTESRTYRKYGKLDDVMSSLNGHFYRCHKSCILNLEKVISMEDGIFYFNGGLSLRIGKNKYQYTRKYYRKYLEQNNK